MKTAYFERFTITLTIDQALTGFHPGSCDHDIVYLLLQNSVKAELETISDNDLKAELTEYGAWSPEELTNRDTNEARIIWLACGQITEELEENHETV